MDEGVVAVEHLALLDLQGKRVGVKQENNALVTPQGGVIGKGRRGYQTNSMGEKRGLGLWCE